MQSPSATRRQFLVRSAAASLAAFGSRPLTSPADLTAFDDVDRSIQVQTPAEIRQTDILFDAAQYTAFPHVIRLEGDELLMAFRQAPRQSRVRHTHPRSVITVVRSYDLGETWDIENAGQLGAGGGQELAPIYLGDGVVGGLLAMHEVVPVNESERSGIPQRHSHEYPFRNVGGFWCWSDNHGLTWPLHQQVLFAPGMQTCAAPVRLASGELLAPCYGRLQGDEAASNVCYRSEDQGRTWSGPAVMARGAAATRDYYEPCLLELSAGHVLAMHRVGRCQDGRLGLFWWNESTDGGRTWSQPAETTITSGACPRLTKLTDGRVLLTFGRRYAPFGLYARLSSDGGRHWDDTSWLLRTAPNANQGYSSSAELGPGQVFTACYAQNEQGITGITGTFWRVPDQK